MELEDVLDQSAAKDTTATTTTTSSSESAQADSQVQVESEQDINSENNDECDGVSAHVPQDTIAKRRQFLDDKLRSYKHEKMKRKLPVDTQL